MRDAQYCIYNKQYTKDEYEVMVATIITSMQEQWTRWEFFPIAISPFAYNQTLANTLYPMSKEDATSKWYRRANEENTINIPEWAVTITPKDFTRQERAALIDDDTLTSKILICAETWRPFRILPQDLKFYRTYGIIPPYYHPDVRHEHRTAIRPARGTL